MLFIFVEFVFCENMEGIANWCHDHSELHRYHVWECLGNILEYLGKSTKKLEM